MSVLTESKCSFVTEIKTFDGHKPATGLLVDDNYLISNFKERSKKAYDDSFRSKHGTIQMITHI